MAKKKKQNKKNDEVKEDPQKDTEAVATDETGPADTQDPPDDTQITETAEADGPSGGERRQTQTEKSEVGVEAVSVNGDDRQTLEEEVQRLKLENEEAGSLRQQLEESEKEKQRIKVQYDALLARIGSMKSLFTKMKENELELGETREQLEHYEKQNLQLKHKVESVQKEKQELEKTVSVLKEESESLNAECDRLSGDLSALRNEHEERDQAFNDKEQRLTSGTRQLEKEVEQLKDLKEELMITIENDKMVISSLNSDVTRLQEQLSDKEGTVNTITAANVALTLEKSELEVALGELQKSVEATTIKHMESMKLLQTELESQQEQNSSLKIQGEHFQQQALKTEKLEQELKEKQLQLGKLRHEAVVLNEHLTKALQLIKRNSNSETVDKELVTNLFISFLTIPRGDTKKFEVLQLIANFLGWGEDQKLQAGLSHHARGRGRESFVSLWTEYLEKESS